MVETEFDVFESAFDDDFVIPERSGEGIFIEDSPADLRRRVRPSARKATTPQPPERKKINAYDTSIADRYEQIVAAIKSDLSPLGEVKRITGEITPVSDGVLMDTVQAVVESESFTKEFLIDISWSDRKHKPLYKLCGTWVNSLDEGYGERLEAHEDATISKVMNRLEARGNAIVHEVEEGREYAEKVIEEWNNSFLDKVMKLPRKVTTGTAVVSGTALIPVLTTPMPVELGLPLLAATPAITFASWMVGRKKKSYWQGRECDNQKMLEDAVPESLTEWNDDRTKQFYDLFEDVSERGIFMDRVLELCKQHKLDYHGEIQVTPMGEGYGIASHVKKPLVMFTVRRKWDGDFYPSFGSGIEWKILFDGKRLYRINDDSYRDTSPIMPY